MIKTLNSCHFDQELREKALYCEPLTNLLPNFELKLCFGFHYGSAIEGIQLYYIAVLKNAIRYFLCCLLWFKRCLLQVSLDQTFGLNPASLHWTLTFKQLYKFVVSPLIFFIWSVTAAAPFPAFVLRACLFESPWPYLWSSHYFYILSLPFFSVALF
jgi:hypothetical protein